MNIFQVNKYELKKKSYKLIFYKLLQLKIATNNQTKFKKKLTKQNWERNQQFAKFHQNLAQKIIKSSKNTIKMENSQKYWWTEEIEKVWLEKKEALRTYNRVSSTENFLEFNRLTAILKKLIKKEKKKIQSIDPNTPTK